MAVTRIRVNEGASEVITGTILDRNGVLVRASSLVSAYLTLYDMDTYVNGSPATGIINERDHQDILGAGSPPTQNQVTIYDDLQTDTDGTTYSYKWESEKALDHPVVTKRRQVERHMAVFEFESASDAVVDQFEIDVQRVRTQS